MSPRQSLLSATAHKSSEGNARQIFFRYTGVDDHYGKLAVVDYPGLGVPHFIDSLACDVVHFANGQGICLFTNPPMYTTYAAALSMPGFNRISKFRCKADRAALEFRRMEKSRA